MRQHNVLLHFAWAIGLAIAFIVFAGQGWAQPQPPGQALFQRNCADCHSADGGAPAMVALNAMPTENIFDAMMKGKMKEQAAAMTSRERRNVAEFLGKRPLNDPAAGDVTKMTNRARVRGL